MRDLEFRHLQIDEMWTFCRKKAHNITGEEPDVGQIGTFYLFIALDEDTRLIPAFRIDRRDENGTMAFMQNLAGRLKWPKPHASDAHNYKKAEYKPFIRISTDAFPPYPAVIREVFGPYAQYAQIVKSHPKDGVVVAKRLFSKDIDPKQVTTSLIERSNLTSRTFMKRLNRKTIGFSKKLENLRAAVAIHFAHYNYCWKIKTFKTTPAVKAGIAARRLTFTELYMHLRERFPEHFLNVDRDAA